MEVERNFPDNDAHLANPEADEQIVRTRHAELTARKESGETLSPEEEDQLAMDQSAIDLLDHA